MTFDFGASISYFSYHQYWYVSQTRRVCKPMQTFEVNLFSHTNFCIKWCVRYSEHTLILTKRGSWGVGGGATTSEDLFVFVVFLIIKVCRRTSDHLSVFVVFLIFLFYFSLQQIFSNGFSVISHPISMTFGMLIALDETNRLNKSIGPGVGTRRGTKVLLCFIIGKTLYTVRRDKNFT